MTYDHRDLLFGRHCDHKPVSLRRQFCRPIRCQSDRQQLAPDAITDFIHDQFDRVALAHSTLSPDALALIVRSSEGILS